MIRFVLIPASQHSRELLAAPAAETEWGCGFIDSADTGYRRFGDAVTAVMTLVAPALQEMWP
jgi:hypothetical protein